MYNLKYFRKKLIACLTLQSQMNRLLVRKYRIIAINIYSSLCEVS